VAIWDWQDGQLERSIDTGGNEAVLSPSGDLIVSTPRYFFAGSQVAEVWDWATGQHLRTLAGHSGGVTHAAFSPDGSRLATASRDGTVRLWDPDTGEQQLVLRGHDGEVSSVAFSPDGSRLASVSIDGTVRVWELGLDELVEIAENGLTRSLNDEECRQYLHVERCPQA
jgi:WD40 repeat protein